MIKVKKYKVQLLEHFDYANRSLGFLNEYESLDLRCQIKEKVADGYYLNYNGHKIDIDSTGGIDHNYDGMYDASEKLIQILLGLK